MHLPAIVGVVLLAGLVALATPASAWIEGASFRCGSRLVGAGQTVAEVYSLCGDPTDRFTTTELVTVRLQRDVAVTRPVVIDRWTYDRGPLRFLRVLTFEDGVLVDVAEGPYGH